MADVVHSIWGHCLPRVVKFVPEVASLEVHGDRGGSSVKLYWGAYLLVLENRHVTDIIAIVYLIGTNNTFIKFRDLFAIVDLLLSIQVDGSIVNSELVLSEKWNGCLL